MDIPRDKNYPTDAVQCHGCGGHGCSACGKRGWVLRGSAAGRGCLFCGELLAPAHVAVYCSNECALQDAPVDTSDIPEATEAWFKKAKRVDPH